VIKKSLCTWQLHCNHQVHRDFLITLYISQYKSLAFRKLLFHVNKTAYKLYFDRSFEAWLNYLRIARRFSCIYYEGLRLLEGGVFWRSPCECYEGECEGRDV